MSIDGNRPIRVRMAPSPTGFLHIGTARTALFNWLFARHHKGAFILRIEDTDADRSKVEHEIGLINGLHWLGIEWDEGPELVSSQETVVRSPEIRDKGDYGPYHQKDRAHLYSPYVEKLLNEGRAYYCYCTKEELEAQRQEMEASGLPPKYSGHCRDLKNPPAGRKPQIIRFKTPEIKVKFKDIIRGSVEMDAALFGDIVIARDADNVLYNFANVVDDELMEISHVIRGEDHISNTPKQALIAHALGFNLPHYAHIPLVLDAKRAKLSKRDNQADFSQYQKEGYLPEAMINFLSLLGWHPKDDKEFMMPHEVIERFDLDRVQKAGAVFNREKLDWLNREHIKNLPTSELVNRIRPFLEAAGIEAESDLLLRALESAKSRLKNLAEFAPSNFFLFKLEDYNPALLVWREDDKEKTRRILDQAYVILSSQMENNFTKGALLKELEEMILHEGKGSVLWPIRAAMSGRDRSPDGLEIAEILGKHETLSRVKVAIEKLHVIAS